MGNVPSQKDGNNNTSNNQGGSVSGRQRTGAPGGPRNYPHQQQQHAAAPSSSISHHQNQYTPGGQVAPGGGNIYPPPPPSSHQHYDGRSSSMTDANMNDMTDLLSLDDDTVPTVFRWEHGGRQVYITGTFNGWSRQIPMHRSGNDFTYIHNLKRGKHAFKFIVDDEWRFAPDQPTVADIEGRINNFIDVTDFRPYTGDKNFEERAEGVICVPSSSKDGKASSVSVHANDSTAVGAAGTTGEGGGEKHPMEEDGFSNNMPDLDEYTKEPPPLPPHLRHIILNKPPQLSDTAALPVPQHVALNHLYCTAIKDNMMVLGVTQRYKTKFVTTVYYSPCTS